MYKEAIETIQGLYELFPDVEKIFIKKDKSVTITIKEVDYNFKNILNLLGYLENHFPNYLKEYKKSQLGRL